MRFHCSSLSQNRFLRTIPIPFQKTNQNRIVDPEKLMSSDPSHFWINIRRGGGDDNSQQARFIPQLNVIYIGYALRHLFPRGARGAHFAEQFVHRLKIIAMSKTPLSGSPLAIGFVKDSPQAPDPPLEPSVAI